MKSLEVVNPVNPYPVFHETYITQNNTHFLPLLRDEYDKERERETSEALRASFVLRRRLLESWLSYVLVRFCRAAAFRFFLWFSDNFF